MVKHENVWIVDMKFADSLGKNLVTYERITYSSLEYRTGYGTLKQLASILNATDYRKLKCAFYHLKKYWTRLRNLVISLVHVTRELVKFRCCEMQILDVQNKNCFLLSEASWPGLA